MANQHIQEQLDALQQQIGELGIDETKRSQLQGLVEDIETELTTGNEGVNEDDGLVERVEELMSGFEAEHPTIAGLLKDIMVKLASIGV